MIILNPTTEDEVVDQVGVFLNYIEKDDYYLCRVYVSFLGKPVTVSQTQLRLLSKKR